MTPSSGLSGPSWYDVLGVERHASHDEIKAAWREATDTFEPGSGSRPFRMFNEAADVLLDPARRATYDASLEAVAPVSYRPDEGRDVVDPEPATPALSATEVRHTSFDSQSLTPSQTTPRATVRLTVITAVLALLVAAAAATAAYLGSQVRREAQVEEARSQAPAAAERALPVVLSYDYRHLAADRKNAGSYLTDSYREDYDETFALLETGKDGAPGPAVQTKTVVRAQVVGSAVVEAEADKARVLVFVNQNTAKQGQDPQVFQNRVSVTMKRSGDRWLLDALKSY